MSAETILYIILSLLRADNANNLDHPQVNQHLVEVAESIEAHATRSVPAERLISLAYNESRFGYKYVLKGTYPKSSWGACGIYQQVVKFSRIETTCKKLGTDVDHATQVAVAYLDYMIDRWKIKGSTKMDNRMCHYYSGNSCDDNKDGKLNNKDEAMKYASRHRKARLKAIKFSKKVKLKVKKNKLSDMTREEFLYVLHNEKNEKRRSELGLPPRKL